MPSTSVSVSPGGSQMSSGPAAVSTRCRSMAAIEPDASRPAQPPSAQGLELLRVGQRVPAQLAGLGDLVRANPPQRRRVGVQRDGRAATGMADAVDVRGAERECLTGPVGSARGAAPEHEALLAQRPLDDGDGAGRQIVVVEPRVLIVAPADHPDRDVLVAHDLRVAPLVGVGPGELLPQCGARAERAHEREQLVAREVAAERALDHAATAARPATSRDGLAVVIASYAAPPSTSSLAGSTTGRSVPYTSGSIPTTRAIASIARGP